MGLWVLLKHNFRPCCCYQPQVKLWSYKTNSSYLTVNTRWLVITLYNNCDKTLIQLYYKWCYANIMEMNEYKYKTKFHSISDTNHEQGTEEMEEQVDLNPLPSLLMVSKVTQWFNGAPIPTFVYTNETVEAICAKPSPEPTCISFLNEYDSELEFSNNLELHKIPMDLQQITQWFGYNVVVTCKVVT